MTILPVILENHLLPCIYLDTFGTMPSDQHHFQYWLVFFSFITFIQSTCAFCDKSWSLCTYVNLFTHVGWKYLVFNFLGNTYVGLHKVQTQDFATTTSSPITNNLRLFHDFSQLTLRINQHQTSRASCRQGST